MLVTPKLVSNCDAVVRSSCTPGMASVAAPAALVDAGMLSATAPAGGALVLTSHQAVHLPGLDALDLSATSAP